MQDMIDARWAISMMKRQVNDNKCTIYAPFTHDLRTIYARFMHHLRTISAQWKECPRGARLSACSER